MSLSTVVNSILGTVKPVGGAYSIEELALRLHNAKPEQQMNPYWIIANITGHITSETDYQALLAHLDRLEGKN